MRTHLTLTKEDDVLSPDLSRPPIKPNMSQRKLERRRNDRTSLLRLVEVGRVDGVDAADVVEVEAPEIDGGGGAEGTGEEVFDAGEEVVGEFEVAVTDPLLSLKERKEVSTFSLLYSRGYGNESRGRKGVGTREVYCNSRKERNKGRRERRRKEKALRATKAGDSRHRGKQ
jgi:hypothetical protein